MVKSGEPARTQRIRHAGKDRVRQDDLQHIVTQVRFQREALPQNQMIVAGCRCCSPGDQHERLDRERQRRKSQSKKRGRSSEGTQVPDWA